MKATELEDLLRRQESKNVDFKAAGEFAGAFRAAIAVDVAAMANTPGGGSLLIGVRQNNGAWTVEGVSAGQLKSFDKTPVVQYLRNFLDPVPSLGIETVEWRGATVLHLAVQEFEDVPIVVKKTIQRDGKPLAKEGDLLIRSEAAQSRTVQSSDELRRLLGRAISRKSENLLADIRAVVTGAGPRRFEETPSELFDGALPLWRAEVAGFDDKFKSYARWEVRILPMPPLEPVDPKLLPMILRSAAISYRGWNFPHIDSKGGPVFGHGHVELRTDWQDHQEVALFSERGGFGFTTVIWSDLRQRQNGFDHPEPPDRILDAIGMLWSLTEFFRFTVNLAEGLKSDSVWLNVRLKGIRGRSLGSFDPSRMWWGDRQSRTEEVPLDEFFTVADLKGSWMERARDWAKKVFTVFQWPDADDAVLSKEQDRLIERRW